MDAQIVFYMAFFSVFTLLHIFLGHRLLTPTGWSRQRKALGWTVVAGILCFQIFSMSLYRGWDSAHIPAWLHVKMTLVYMVMGTGALLLLLFLGRDLLRLVDGLRLRLSRLREPAPSPEPPPSPQRRRFLNNGVNLGLLGVSFGLSGTGFINATGDPQVDFVEVPIKGLHPDLDGLRIVHLTDLHVGPTLRRPFVERVVTISQSLNPDILAMTGDMIDGHPELLREHLEPLKTLRAPLGNFWVTGNHEYYWRVEPWCAEAERLGFTVLNNEHRLVRRGAGTLLVGGVTDFEAERLFPQHRSDPHKAIAGASPEASGRILLAHQPRSCFEAAKAGFDLQLSGHTHGGQFIPWNFLVRLQQPFVSGLDRHEELWVYTSRGTGYWGPPLRLGVPAEIAVLTLRSAPPVT